MFVCCHENLNQNDITVVTVTCEPPGEQCTS